MNILIIEDDLGYLDFIENEVKKVFTEAHLFKASSVIESVKIIQEYDLALIVSDIELQDKKLSFEIFENTTFNGKVIFISSFDTYALKAIKMSACDYILKPIDQSELEIALKNIKSSFPKKGDNNLNLLLQNLSSESKKILVSDRKETHIIELDDVCYFESDGQYTRIVFFNKEDGIFVSSMPIKHFEEIITNNFFRCHRSFIVNLKNVKSFTFSNDIKLKNGMVVPLAKAKKNEFKEALGTIN